MNKDIRLKNILKSSQITKHKFQMSILITGSNGFVGSNLAKYLSSKDLKIISSSRKKYDNNGFKQYQITELNQFTNWRGILEGKICAYSGLRASNV